MTTYHVEVVYETIEYFRVEATSEEEAKEKVFGGEVECYNWDQNFQSTEIETLLG